MLFLEESVHHALILLNVKHLLTLATGSQSQGNERITAKINQALTVCQAKI